MSNTREQIFEAIRSLVCDLFGAEQQSISLQSRREDIPGWDSLQHVNLIMDVERHFRITLSEEHVGSIATVGDLVDAVCVAGHVVGEG